MPTTLMQIICPRCDTSYGVDGTAFPPEGRPVRCARCQEVWTAQANYPAKVEPAFADPEPAVVADDASADDVSVPLAESPPLADDNPPGWQGQDHFTEDTTEASVAPANAAKPRPVSRISSLFRREKKATQPRSSKIRSRSSSKLAGVVAGFGAVVAGLVIWRADIVRLMPQTAIAFKAIGMPVNLRGMALQDMKVRTETVDGAAVLVIEGTIKSVTQKPVEIPRLRFIVRDERGNEIYAWNAVLEQAVLKPGETLGFRSRLASPPAEARDIEIRFFHRRDMARGAA